MRTLNSSASKKRRLFDIIQIGNRSDVPSRAFDIFIVAAIFLNITALFLLTFDGLRKYFPIFHAIEWITILIFCVEYILRLWTAQYLYPELSPGKAALRFAGSFYGIIDLLAILPFFFLSGFIVFRMLRVVRIFHLFRINANYDSFHVIRTVLYEKRNPLLSSVFIIFVLMLASAICMYSVEHAAQPESFQNGFSGIWWSMSALLTVGYGDIYPITVLGRVLAIVIALLGVGLVAIPTGIISAGFVEHYTKMQNSAPGEDIHLQTLIVDMDSAWLGRTITEVEKEFGAAIVMIRRGDRTILPHDERDDGEEAYRVSMGDALVVYRKHSGTHTK